MSVVFMLFIKFSGAFCCTVHLPLACFLQVFKNLNIWGGTLLAEYTFFLNFCFAFCFVREDF